MLSYILRLGTNKSEGAWLHALSDCLWFPLSAAPARREKRTTSST